MRRPIQRRCKCGLLIEQGKNCPKCKSHKKLYNRRQWRGGGNTIGIRPAFLASNPLCVECERQGKVEAATEVDHIRPHRGNWELFTAWDNLQGLCNACHWKKTHEGE